MATKKHKDSIISMAGAAKALGYSLRHTYHLAELGRLRVVSRPYGNGQALGVRAADVARLAGKRKAAGRG